MVVEGEASCFGLSRDLAAPGWAVELLLMAAYARDLRMAAETLRAI